VVDVTKNTTVDATKKALPLVTTITTITTATTRKQPPATISVDHHLLPSPRAPTKAIISDQRRGPPAITTITTVHKRRPPASNDDHQHQEATNVTHSSKGLTSPCD
jgi:hypothetical protein